MEAKDIHFEEGEISNDSDNTYTPLERPVNYSVSQPLPRLPANRESESEEELVLQSSESDSDSDPNVRKCKKQKIKLKPTPKQRNRSPKKYDIWSTRVQEDVLAETLNSCDVTKKDRTREVESYDYTLAIHEHYDMFLSNKRTRDDRNNVNFKQKKLSKSKESVKGKERIILDLVVNIDSTVEEIAKEMSNKLCEEKEDLLVKVINTLGKQKALDTFKETQKIEEDGGMLILNQTRRRTPGGVYFYLIKHDYHLTREQKEQIFDDDRQQFKKNIASKKKIKNMKLKCEIAASRAKIMPDLLTRAELLASQNPGRKVTNEAEETVCVNPPPTPETDGHENSGDGMDDVPPTLDRSNESCDNVRGKLNSYDSEFLDITCSNDMDLF